MLHTQSVSLPSLVSKVTTGNIPFKY